MGRQTKNKYVRKPKRPLWFSCQRFSFGPSSHACRPSFDVCVCVQALLRALGLIVGPRSRISRRSFERLWLDPSCARSPHALASSHPHSEESLLGVVAALTSAEGAPSCPNLHTSVSTSHTSAVLFAIAISDCLPDVCSVLQRIVFELFAGSLCAVAGRVEPWIVELL